MGARAVSRLSGGVAALACMAPVGAFAADGCVFLVLLGWAKKKYKTTATAMATAMMIPVLTWFDCEFLVIAGSLRSEFLAWQERSHGPQRFVEIPFAC